MLTSVFVNGVRAQRARLITRVSSSSTCTSLRRFSASTLPATREQLVAFTVLLHCS